MLLTLDHHNRYHRCTKTEEKGVFSSRTGKYVQNKWWS